MASTKQIADRIVTGLLKKPNTYSVLEARAKELDIPMHQFDDAMALVHKNKRIKQTTKGDEIHYSTATTPARKAPGSHLKWLRDNYPRMNSTNDGSGIEADYSYMFLTPEELDKFKAELSGRTFIPKRKYRKKG